MSPTVIIMSPLLLLQTKVSKVSQVIIHSPGCITFPALSPNPLITYFSSSLLTSSYRCKILILPFKINTVTLHFVVFSILAIINPWQCHEQKKKKLWQDQKKTKTNPSLYSLLQNFFMGFSWAFNIHLYRHWWAYAFHRETASPILENNHGIS